MAEMPVKTINVRESTRFTQRGTIERVYLVEFLVGDLGPYTVELSETEFNADVAAQRMEEKARQIRALAR